MQGEDILDENAAALRVPWPVLSAVLGVMALGSLGALAVVAAVKGTDLLSTVALALAILSFAAQLIITLAQGFQSARVNSDMKAALSELKTSSAALLTNQRNQFETVLQAALRYAIPAAVEDVQSSDEAVTAATPETSEKLAAELEQRLSVRLEQALRDRQPAERTWTPVREDPSEARARVEGRLAVQNAAVTPEDEVAAKAVIASWTSEELLLARRLRNLVALIDGRIVVFGASPGLLNFAAKYKLLDSGRTNLWGGPQLNHLGVAVIRKIQPRPVKRASPQTTD